MEIIAEIVLRVLGWALQFLGEIALQAVFELLAEFLGRSVIEPFRQPRPIHPFFAVMGYLIFGATAGAISLWLLPTLMIVSPHLRMANLVVTPLAVGAIMACLGSWRRRHDQETVRLDTFFYGFCFALAMAIVRFVWGS